MGWAPFLTQALYAASPLAPVAEASAPASLTEQIIGRFLGYGIVGIICLVLAWIIYKGSFIRADTAAAMVTAGRADLLEENKRLREELASMRDQRDEAVRALGDQLIPMLLSFTSATQALLPLLQEMVRRRERQIDP